MLSAAAPRERFAADAPWMKRGEWRTSRLARHNLVPLVAGWGFVARGLGLTAGASEGCGGGVARRRSSLRT